MSQPKYEPFQQEGNPHDHDSDAEAGPGHRDANPGKAICQLCCCCLFLVFVIVQGCFAFGRNGGCSALAGKAEGQVWNPIIPSTSTCQYSWKFFWSEVDVFNPAITNETAIGRWVSMNFFGMYTRYGYQDDAGDVLIEVRTPWGFYFGKQYEIWRCDGAGPVFRVEEDYWAEPWFSFGMEKRYNVINGETDMITAKISHSQQGVVWSNWRAEFTSVPPAAPAVIATLDQAISSAWFTAPLWTVKNMLNETATDAAVSATLPNAVVSFMASIYDIEQSDDE